MNHLDIFEHEGKRFRVYIEPDDCGDTPWERSEGHGKVRTISEHYRCDTTQKKPGERVLYTGGNKVWLYDWQDACKQARKDGWNAPPYDAPNRIERAVQADFDFLRGWLNDDWWYVGVCVAMVNEDDEDITEKYTNALWGIESNADEYLDETAHELAGQVEAPQLCPHCGAVMKGKKG